MDDNRMSAENFRAWLAHMKATRGWSKRQCARELGASQNMPMRWAKRGAPYYIALACEAIRMNQPPFQSRD